MVFKLGENLKNDFSCVWVKKHTNMCSHLLSLRHNLGWLGDLINTDYKWVPYTNNQINHNWLKREQTAKRTQKPDTSPPKMDDFFVGL